MKNKEGFSVKSGLAGSLWQLALTMVVLAGITAFAANDFWLSVWTSVSALSLALAGAALLYGQLGLVSLCQFALVGVGGWVTLRIGDSYHVPFLVSVLAGGFGAMLAGLAVSLPALRLRGLYLALVTLMLAGGYETFISVCGFPNGGGGLTGRITNNDMNVLLSRPEIAQSSRAYFLYVSFIVMLGLILVQWHKRTLPGRSWALIRKGEAVAISAGVNSVFYKAWAFALSGFLAGIAGALMAGNFGQLDERGFGAFNSLMLFALCVVGGVYNWFGALIGSALLQAMPALFTDFGVNGYIATGIFGLGLFHALSTAHSGVAGQISGLVTLLSKRDTYTRLRRLTKKGARK